MSNLNLAQPSPILAARADEDESIHIHGSTKLPTAPQAQPEVVLSDKVSTKSLDHGVIAYVTGWKLIAIVACMALGCFLMLVDTMVISTAIPRITDEFHSLVDVGWYASAYQFGLSAPQPLIGKVYTHFKTKWTYLVCFIIFELGSVLCGAATSSAMLIVGRAIAGFGAAGIINGAITIVSSCAPLEKRPTLMGLTMGTQQLGLVVGPIIGGAFTSYSTWRWSFYINLPIGAFVILGVILLPIPEQTRKDHFLPTLLRVAHLLDLVGFVLFAPAVLQLLLALQYGGNQYAWNSSQVIGLFCGSAATFVVWLLWNWHKGEESLLPRSVIGRRAVWSAAMFNAFAMAAMFGALYYLPIYFQSIKNASAILSGLYIVPYFLPQLLMAGIAGPILQRMGYIIPMAIFCTILLSVGTGLLSLLDPDTPIGHWVGFQILAGVGSGAGLPLGILGIQAVTSGEELSLGMAFMVFTQSLAPAILLTVCNLILVEGLRKKLPSYAPEVDAAAVIRNGATSFRNSVPSEHLDDVLEAFSDSMRGIFYLLLGIALASGLFIHGIGWRDLRTKSSPSVDDTESGSGTVPSKTENPEKARA